MTAKAQRNASGPYLRKVRMELGLSKEEAAERIGVSVRTLEKYERQGLSGSMGWNNFFSICVTYNVSAEDLLWLMLEPEEKKARREEMAISGVEMAERLGYTVGDIIDLEFPPQAQA